MMDDAVRAGVEAIGRIAAVPTILDVICRTTGMGFAAVAQVTEGRWVACGVLDRIGFGLVPGGELEVGSTICREIRASGQPVVIDDVALDGTYSGHPTPARYGFRSYISVPIVLRDGQFFGTLCAIDPQPAKLDNPATIGMFRLFAELIGSQIDAGEELRDTRAALVDQRELSSLREQFIAVLGHDLRNPIASIASGVRLLGRSVQDEGGKKILGLMHSSAMRAKGLVSNLMDFAQARLGDGLSLEVVEERPLGPVLEQVIAELQSTHPERAIETAIALDEAVAVDHGRIGQLLSNLLGNALAHGSAAVPVRVGAATRDGAFELWVANAGPPIPPEAMANLFQPFFRGKVRSSLQGLGLGLYIAAEIARVHGGTLEVASGVTETRFTFRMPLRRGAV